MDKSKRWLHGLKPGIRTISTRNWDNIDPIAYEQVPMADAEGRITFPTPIGGVTNRIVDRTTAPDPDGSQVCGPEMPQLRHSFITRRLSKCAHHRPFAALSLFPSGGRLHKRSTTPALPPRPRRPQQFRSPHASAPLETLNSMTSSCATWTPECRRYRIGTKKSP